MSRNMRTFSRVCMPECLHTTASEKESLTKISKREHERQRRRLQLRYSNSKQQKKNTLDTEGKRLFFTASRRHRLGTECKSFSATTSEDHEEKRAARIDHMTVLSNMIASYMIPDTVTAILTAIVALQFKGLD